MPKKITGERFVKVVSTKLSEEDYLLLDRYARGYYFESKISQPSISHMLRYIFKGWATQVKEREKRNSLSIKIPGVNDILKGSGTRSISSP
jgi:hypothetical protein